MAVSLVYFAIMLAEVLIQQVFAIQQVFSPNLTILPSFPTKPRLFILTDILNEPDDSMSMVRLLLYSNEFDLQGLCATTSSSLRNATHPEAISEIIDAYGLVVDNLNSHVHPESQFRAAASLKELVVSGPKVYGNSALSQPISEGASLLIQSLKSSQDPLYVSIWGGANVLAQALRHIEQDNSAAEAAELRSRLRVYSISDQDDSGPYIRRRWSDIVYIVNIHGFIEFNSATWAGINSADNGAANMTMVLDPWLTPNIRVGPLGAVYPLIIYGMEGDSPSFMWLIQNGLSNPARPDWGGWGGRYTRITELEDILEYGTSLDNAVGLTGRHTSPQATIWRWREAYQGDFAARMQWSLTSNFSKVAHSPVIDVNGTRGTQPMSFQIPVNGSIILDASKSYSPDDPTNEAYLEFEWYTYLEAGIPRAAQQLNQSFLQVEALAPPRGTNGTLPVNAAGFENVQLGSKVRIVNQIPKVSVFEGIEWHVILQAKSTNGLYPLYAYRRIVVKSL
ncbi:hypothetical protein O1611_g469 [Lasiodiplodia mahajangana]|uniref:Uncharacterized protein n=1 Tax=Lasiodiplodia mahajangana TaxID=1108764 RepID=A0ACC2K085_9PEZI|nr:hypothetical protein O1611_g469 [Lasiodiplodia mahajangana]